MMHELLTQDLVGGKLSCVAFVMDYLQLDFDGNGFTMYIWPSILCESKEIVLSELSYRNGLCSLIAKIVTRIDYVEDEMIQIIFDEANSIYWSINVDMPENIPEKGIYGNTKGQEFIFQ